MKYSLKNMQIVSLMALRCVESFNIILQLQNLDILRISDE